MAMQGEEGPPQFLAECRYVWTIDRPMIEKFRDARFLQIFRSPEFIIQTFVGNFHCHISVYPNGDTLKGCMKPYMNIWDQPSIVSAINYDLSISIPQLSYNYQSSRENITFPHRSIGVDRSRRHKYNRMEIIECIVRINVLKIYDYSNKVITPKSKISLIPFRPIEIAFDWVIDHNTLNQMRKAKFQQSFQSPMFGNTGFRFQIDLYPNGQTKAGTFRPMIRNKLDPSVRKRFKGSFTWHLYSYKIELNCKDSGNQDKMDYFLPDDVNCPRIDALSWIGPMGELSIKFELTIYEIFGSNKQLLNSLSQENRLKRPSPPNANGGVDKIIKMGKLRELFPQLHDNILLAILNHNKGNVQRTTDALLSVPLAGVLIEPKVERRKDPDISAAVYQLAIPGGDEKVDKSENVDAANESDPSILDEPIAEAHNPNAPISDVSIADEGSPDSDEGSPDANGDPLNEALLKVDPLQPKPLKAEASKAVAGFDIFEMKSEADSAPKRIMGWFLTNKCGLPQYIGKFTEMECMDIRMMADIDESMLLSDFGVRKLHCKRIMRCIETLNNESATLRNFMEKCVDPPLSGFWRELHSSGILTWGCLSMVAADATDIARLFGEVSIDNPSVVFMNKHLQQFKLTRIFPSIDEIEV